MTENNSRPKSAPCCIRCPKHANAVGAKYYYSSLSPAKYVRTENGLRWKMAHSKQNARISQGLQKAVVFFTFLTISSYAWLGATHFNQQFPAITEICNPTAVSVIGCSLSAHLHSKLLYMNYSLHFEVLQSCLCWAWKVLMKALPTKEIAWKNKAIKKKI